MAQYVLAKALGGEPAKLVVVGEMPKHVLLSDPAQIERVKSGVSWPVGFPRKDVFEFDEIIFERLLSEWLVGDGEPALWRKLKPWTGRVHAEA